MEDIMQLCDVVRETGFAIHRYHKHGHLEKVTYALSRIEDKASRPGGIVGAILALFASFAPFHG